MVEYNDDDWVVDHFQHALEAHYASLLDDDGRVTASEKCCSCGYDLKGVHINARCPECGIPVQESVWLPRYDTDMRIRLSHARLMAATVLVGLLGRVDLLLGAMLLALAVLIRSFHMPLELGLAALAQGSSLFPVLGPAIVLCLLLHLAGMLALPVALRPGLFRISSRRWVLAHTLLHVVGAAAIAFSVVTGLVLRSPEEQDYLGTLLLSLLNIAILAGPFTGFMIKLTCSGLWQAEFDIEDDETTDTDTALSVGQILLIVLVVLTILIVVFVSAHGVLRSVMIAVGQVWTGSSQDPGKHLRWILSLYALWCGFGLLWWGCVHVYWARSAWLELRDRASDPAPSPAAHGT